MEYDYLIIGAGLAGCTAGRLLAQAGARVLAVDRADLDAKDKLCGGLLTPRAQKLAGALLGEQVQGLVRQRHTEMTVLFNGRVQPLEGVDVAGVMRRDLDRLALERYLGAGGNLADRCRVERLDLAGGRAVLRLESGEAPVRFATLVAADGAASATRKAVCRQAAERLGVLGRNVAQAAKRRALLADSPQVLPSLEAFVEPVDAPLTGMICPAERGYCWYIPCGDTANIGVDAQPGTPSAQLRGMLDGFAQQLGVRVPAGAVRGAFIPSGGQPLLGVSAGGTQAFFVGDAAGLAAPATGEGIYYALQSARQLAVSRISGGPGYSALMAKDVAQLQQQYRMLGLLYSQKASNALLGAADRLGAGQDALVRLALKLFAAF